MNDTEQLGVMVGKNSKELKTEKKKWTVQSTTTI